VTVLVATTVHRGSRKGEPHGGVFLVDLERRRGAHTVTWTRPGIDWQGHGGDRGLRGIATHGERLYLAASEEILVFAPDFALLARHRSPYLRHAQALACFENRLYVASAAYDSILAFDLAAGRFDWGLQLVDDQARLRGTPFDPQGALGPPPANRMHLNSLYCDSRGMFICGLRTMGLLCFDGKRIKRLVTLPEDVRDARPWRDGVLFNDTAANVVRFLTPEHNRVFRVPYYPVDLLEGAEDGRQVARQGFARGLCVVSDRVFASGSSPLTITLHDLDAMQTTLSINLGTDVRQALHSLAVWPFTGG
jgi:hypothetical protein